MARGGGGREEESLGALLSPPPGGGARGPRRLHPSAPRPPSPPAGPSRAAAASAPHPLPDRRGTGRGRGVKGVLLSPPWSGPQHWAAVAPAPPLPHTPSRPSLPVGDPGRRRRRTDGAWRQLKDFSPATGPEAGLWRRAIMSFTCDDLKGRHGGESERLRSSIRPGTKQIFR
uniref:proline-rich protein 2-like n=1 Tax=Urocitellus parryii TaxID=9999 RepID=UPI000E55E755|nr:proline-rich protein 2-like [Urocitellus parryii]